VAAAEERQAQTSLSPEGFAVYWVLQKDRPEQALGVAQAVEAAFKEFPHWQSSEQQDRQVRAAIYKALINGGVDGVVDVASAILKMLRRAAG
jgi:type I restriction enzyme R subunit